jgi:glycosyltransferase involved in cell wall biosynthesis
VASVRAQTFEDWVLHVVEDGCPVRSADAVLAAWPDGDDRLRLLRGERCRGQVAARAWAIETSDAPHVALIDQDDEYLPEKLEAQLATGAAVAYVDVTFVGPDGEVLAERTEDGVRSRRVDVLAGVPSETRVRRLFAGNVLDFPSTMFTRAAYEGVDGWDTRFPGAEDWAFWIELAAAGADFAHVPRRLYRKRVHPDSDGSRTLDERNLAFPACAADLRRRHGISGPEADQRDADLRRRAARSAMILRRPGPAVRHLAAMATHGQLREVPEILGEVLRR